MHWTTRAAAFCLLGIFLAGLGCASLRAGCAGLRHAPVRGIAHGRGMPGGRLSGSKPASLSRRACGTVQ